MLGIIPVRYLLKHPFAVAELLSDPLQTCTNCIDLYLKVREYRRPQCQYAADVRWEQSLHEHLGVPWPCELAAEFRILWNQVMAELEAKGIRPGPESFGTWNDGDAGFVRAIWCAVRHLQPTKVVETGVAHGVTSRLTLEAMERNRRGQLWSIDLPPIEKFWREQVGSAVGDHLRDRWFYLKGSSRRRLPALLSKLGHVDLFIHDSLHSERNVRFELDRVWEVLRPGGIIVVDDVDSNWGFHSFTRTFSGYRSIICEAEPLRPDLRRFNHKGLFGIILKEPTQARAASKA